MFYKKCSNRGNSNANLADGPLGDSYLSTSLDIVLGTLATLTGPS